MKYVSTRSSGVGVPKNFAEVSIEGLGGDGGLYVPDSYPKIDADFLKSIANSTYPELFVKVRSLFIDGAIPLLQQQSLAEQAYSAANFPDQENMGVTPVTRLNGGLVELLKNVWLQDLSRGPTAAFKDLALQPIGFDLEYLLNDTGERLDILGATSGDTGSAAGAAVLGRGALRLFMLSPKNGLSDFQRAQMMLQNGGNVHHISIDGTFDDCHALVKEVVSRPGFEDMGALNSINWARIASQIPYYFSGYLQVVGNNIGREVDFVIPSGNFGNAFSAYVAKLIGLPIRKIVIATNENDVLHKFFSSGVYDVRRRAVSTSSPSMDISSASNLERLFFDLLDRSGSRTNELMHTIKERKVVDLRDLGYSAVDLQRLGFVSGTSKDEDRVFAIESVYRDSDQIIDPHTADAVAVAMYAKWSRVLDDDTPVICMSTAKPVKFESTIKRALGFTMSRQDPRFVLLEQKAQRVGSLATGISGPDSLMEYIAEHR